DEVGELPLEQQVKLLRALQEKRFRPVGAQREVEADFRLVCATNRDLAQMVREGTFREDLFYRIAVVTIPVPPLRERKDDILPLALRFLEAHRART
ncbi:MAG: sigma 54-interacting transcriptional regulator, partial [Myxococcales bacterium]|nr:sigma 54-interacting transcriptional regulator [Myxococcales bacterium]